MDINVMKIAQKVTINMMNVSVPLKMIVDAANNVIIIVILVMDKLWTNVIIVMLDSMPNQML
jgi:hypothetical protein